MTQTQLKAFLDAGMNVLEITVYADSDQTFNAYEKYDGSNVLLGSVKGKEWTTLRIDLQKVYDNYSRLNSEYIFRNEKAVGSSDGFSLHYRPDPASLHRMAKKYRQNRGARGEASRRICRYCRISALSRSPILGGSHAQG